jgi:Ran GTPase-activating protein (RanGAP) involved in mRNA processing and transport
MNIFSKNTEEKLDVLNLIIESNPNQYNSLKIKKKLRSINPLFLRGTEENLKRPNFNQNTEEVFYKYNLLYGNNTTNLIRTYSPKMRPMSASISGFNKKMTHDLNENIFVFSYEEIVELIRARCKDIGIDLRENMIHKFKDYCNSKCKNRIVDLSECYLGIHSIRLISSILYTSDRIARLNLTKNNLGDTGVQILISSIKNSLSLISLNITSNSITHKGGEVIFKELIYQQSIIDLNVSSIEGTNRNRMTAAGIKNLDKFLKINLFIENLNICGNSIKDEGFFILSKGLNNNQSLYKLNISNNDIHHKGLNQGLNLISICKLYSLNISNNPILDEGLKRLTDSLKNFNNLHRLNVSNCGFEFPGFEHLINALQYIKRIEYLNVSGNNIKSENFENLKPCFSTFGIKTLNMSKCSLGNESTYILGECIAGNETIKNLNISENKITDLGFKSFIPLFSNNNVIESFDCSVNFISDITAKEFIKNMKFNRALRRVNFFDNQLKNEMGNLFIEILEVNKTLIYVNLIYNRVQMKTIDEINRILKLNNEKQKAKFLPNLLRDIKGLQFNPELFSFYTQNINNKKTQQEILYKKVREDDRHFTRLLNKENKKIEVKVQEMKSIQSEIVECQKQIKEVREKFDKLQEKMRDHEDEMNEKIDEENKVLKDINNKNSYLEAEFRATKKDLENVIIETKEKYKISQDKLDLAKKSFNSATREIKRKTELYKNLKNPDMLVPIKKGDDLKKSKKISIKKENTTTNSKTTTIETNPTRLNTISANENVLTTNSGSADYKSKESAKINTKKETKKKK